MRFKLQMAAPREKKSGREGKLGVCATCGRYKWLVRAMEIGREVGA